MGILRYFFWLVFLAILAPFSLARAQGELPRAGAPRPLRLVGSDGTPLQGSPGDVAWERSGGGVFFTLERGGTRNIWRAFPDPQDSSRFPAWRALPVTDLRAPRYAAQPTPLPGDRALVCVSNALAGAGAAAPVAQIVRYDLEKSEFRALSDGVRLYQSPQVSPDGTRVAFAGGSGAEMRVFVAPTKNPLKRVMPEVTRVADQARRPVWLDEKSLLMESLAPQSRGLYWTPADGASAPQVVVGGGGEANVLGENGIVFSAKTSASAPSNLYLIARDGSGLRLLAETTGARNPAASPDGQTLAYDAPQGGGRALWVVPLLRVENRAAALKNRGRVRLVADEAPETEGPDAQLSSVRATPGGVAIIGSLRGATPSNLTLEVGQGGKPRRWENLSLRLPLTSPLLDAQGNRVIATWNPPPRARGEWTLRLSLRGLGGGSQSLLRVRLPLPAPAPQILPPVPANSPQNSPANARPPGTGEPLPRATPLPNPPDVVPVRSGFLLPAPIPAPAPIPVPSEKDGDDVPQFPAIEPPTSPLPHAVPAKVPPTTGVEIAPVDPASLPAAVPPANAPANVPTNPLTTAATSPARVESDDDYGDRPDAPAGTPWVAQFNVAGTPAHMAPREKVKVTFWGWNRGTVGWETGGSGANRVRLVARWVDFSTGTRRQWNYFWLREAVAPGERTKWEFDLPAPARAGKYKLIYGLIRLPASGEYKQPAYSEPQETWPDEFGAIAFAVEVAPNSP